MSQSCWQRGCWLDMTGKSRSWWFENVPCSSGAIESSTWSATQAAGTVASESRSARIVLHSSVPSCVQKGRWTWCATLTFCTTRGTRPYFKQELTTHRIRPTTLQMVIANRWADGRLQTQSRLRLLKFGDVWRSIDLKVESGRCGRGFRTPSIPQGGGRHARAEPTRPAHSHRE